MPPHTITLVAHTTSTMIGENVSAEADENAPTPETIGGKEWINNLKLYASDEDDLKSCQML